MFIIINIITTRNIKKKKTRRPRLPDRADIAGMKDTMRVYTRITCDQDQLLILTILILLLLINIILIFLFTTL